VFDAELGKIKTAEMVLAISKGSLQRTANDISVVNILRIERERNLVGIFASQQMHNRQGVVELLMSLMWSWVKLK
jgi:hypothetical protein